MVTPEVGNEGGPRRYVFGATHFDPGARELVHDGVAVEMEPGTMAVLRYLIEHRHRVVPKEELLDEIWGDRFVSESALTTRVKHARSAVGDDGRRQAVIKTVHRVGYRFVADLVVHDGSPDAPAERVRVAPSAHWSTPRRRPLIGRDRELDELRDRVEACALVTLVGPAGVGKSSLARAFFEHVDRRDAWFCEWGDARAPDAVAMVVLNALGETQRADVGAGESVIRILEARTGLLVLDNCEHVLAAATDLAQQLGQRCPGLRILATSRVALGLPDESVLAVEPLAIDDAARCFVERARDAGAQVRTDDPALHDLCRRLDGLPLAIEMAAARARSVSPAEMLELLEDRFRLLSVADDGARTSLHESIAASWDALDRSQRTLLSRLGVFVGSFDIDGIRRVALPDAPVFDAIDAVEQLVRRSMVVAIPAPDGRTRFRLLESVRDFALESLVDPAAIKRAHVSYVVERTEELDLACQTTEIDAAFGEFAEIWVNVRAAVGYAAECGDVASVRRIVVAVAEYAEMHTIYELLEWCDAAGLHEPTPPGDDDTLAADAAAVRARMLAHRCQPVLARSLAEEALSRHESRTTLQAVVWCAFYLADIPAVLAHMDRLLGCARSTRGLDRAFADGFDATARAGSGESGSYTRAVDPSMAATDVLGLLDVVTEGHRLCVAEPLVAAELLEAAFDVAVRDDRDLILSSAGTALNVVIAPARPLDQVVATLGRTLFEYGSRGLLPAISSDLVVAARVLAEAGMVDLAARLLGARQGSGYALGPSELLLPEVSADVRTTLGAQYDELIAQGAQWSLSDAARIARDALSSVVPR